MRNLMYQTSSVSQITPTCQHQFLEINIQSTNFNLWTTNLWKWTKISLKTKIDSKQPRVCPNLQRQREQREWREAPDQPRRDLQQGDPLAMNLQMFNPNKERQNSKRLAGCKISTGLNERSSKRPSRAVVPNLFCVAEHLSQKKSIAEHTTVPYYTLQNQILPNLTTTDPSLFLRLSVLKNFVSCKLRCLNKISRNVILVFFLIVCLV